MILKLNVRYKISINSAGRVLTYNCEVLNIDDDFIEIKDKFNNYFLIKKDKIISCEEVQDGSEY